MLACISSSFAWPLILGAANRVHEIEEGREMVVKKGVGQGRKGVDGRRGRTYVAFPADHLLAIILAGQGLERGFDNATAEAEHEVEG